MPLRVAILRAWAKSVSGSRRAICTLAVLFSLSTSGEPFDFPLLPVSADSARQSARLMAETRRNRTVTAKAAGDAEKQRGRRILF